MIHHRCSECVTDKSQCVNCPENPTYDYISRFTLFKPYIPTCPRGYDDCVSDPAYIKYHNPQQYKKLYGDKTPEEVSIEKCQKYVEEDPDKEYYCSMMRINKRDFESYHELY